jgi:hypothetical protein
MSASGQPGPTSVEGLKPPLNGPMPYIGGGAALVSNLNQDAGPSLYFMGIGLRDIRYLQRIGAGANVAGGYPNQDVGFYGPDPMVTDAVPSTISNVNIAAAQASVMNTPLNLVAVSGAGITLLATPFTVLPTGLVVPAGSLAIDGNPNWAGAGPVGAFSWFDPTKGLARCVSLTSVSNLSGINYTVKGYDIYGNPMTQTLAGPNNNTVNTKKAFKWVASVTPNAASANLVSIGTSDIYGFNLQVNEIAYLDTLVWNSAGISSSTGFTAADTTSPATALTGDVRGTYATQSASDGAKSLQIAVRMSLANVIGPLYANFLQGLFGVPQV